MNDEQQHLTKKERRMRKRREKEQNAEYRNRKRAVKRITFWSAITVFIFGAVVGVIQLGKNAAPAGSTLLTGAVSASDWVSGNSKAGTILVEYSDLQCPACSFYYPLLKQLKDEFGENLQFVYRHFPLAQHANAEHAAYAAEAAGRQGKFWDMHDMLFEHQQEWSEHGDADGYFTSYAQTLGLDMTRFRDDFGSSAVQEKVKNDYQSGLQSGVNATPTFFLNGEKISNPRNYDEFRTVIAAAIAKHS